jgi:phage-related baseplate assembly protein
MATIDLATLLIRETKAEIYAKGLQVATALGLPVTTWHAGDPTRSDYWFIAELQETWETIVTLFIGAGFLDEAEEDWLTLHAEQMYDVARVDATFATCSVTLTNGGGGSYTIEAGDLTVRNSTTDATFRNTTGGTLSPGPGTTLALDFTADESGAESSSAIGEVDEMVTALLGVTCANTTAAVGIDAQSDDSLREQCRDKLGALSPNGPRDAYSYVAKSYELTTTAAVTRVRVFDDTDTGDVQIYVAGSSGAITAPELALVEEAIVTYAVPICITPTVSNAANLTVAVTYSLWLYASDSRTVGEVEEAVEAALEQLFAGKAIGGDIISPATTGYLYTSDIIAAISAVSSYSFRVTLAAPAANVAMTNSQVAVLGTVTPTVTIVDDP